MTLNLRRAQSTDLDALTALLQLYFREQDIARRDTPALLRQELSAAQLGFFLAEDENGMLQGCILGHALPSLGPLAAECKRLFVRPDARGQGLATLLLQHLETEAANAGFRWLYLDSLERFTVALRLYTRHGFQPCPPYPGSDPQATLFFRKPLLHTHIGPR